jgi:tellurite resistance protein
MAETLTPYITSEEVRIVVRRFESCDFEPGGFHHSHHLTVAMCYLQESTEDEAITRMRAGLLKFLKHNESPAAYHETITVFWIKRVRQILDRADKTLPLADLANSVVAGCSNVSLINVHFSKERLASDDARMNWLEPDLKPLECFSNRNQ